jgi:hypothetical protein
LANLAEYRGSAVLGDHVEDVGAGRRFDLDLFEQFSGARGDVKLFAHPIGHFGRMGDQNLRVGFPLRF